MPFTHRWLQNCPVSDLLRTLLAGWRVKPHMLSHCIPMLTGGEYAVILHRHADRRRFSRPGNPVYRDQKKQWSSVYHHKQQYVLRRNTEQCSTHLCCSAQRTVWIQPASLFPDSSSTIAPKNLSIETALAVVVPLNAYETPPRDIE